MAGRALRLGLPLAGLLTLAGYFAVWIPHPAAGLAVTGLDLGELVKFLPPVQSGQIPVWREGFYLPLVAVSLAFSLIAFRPELAYPWPLRVGLIGLALVAAANLLPPAWTPARLLMPEFRLQTAWLVLCVLAGLGSPLLALAPRRAAAGLLIGLALIAAASPVMPFLRVLPVVAGLYRESLAPGWGMWATLLGLGLLAALGAVGMAGNLSKEAR